MRFSFTTFAMTRLSIAATALLAVAGAGCGDLQAIAQDILDHQKGGNSSDGGAASGCYFNGVHYAEGDKFPKDDCNTCYCMGGGITCTTTACAPPPVCKDFNYSSPDQCLGKDEFYKLASDNCAKLGLVLGNLSLDNDCDGLSTHTGRYTCCTPPAGSDGGTGPSQSCEKIPEGGGDFACRDYGAWKSLGTQTCAGRGEVLTDLVLGQSCGSDLMTATSATFVCCGPNVQPAPDKCMRLDGGGDATSCKPSMIWDAYGAEACSALDLTLTDIGYSASCSKTGPNYSDATYLCCAGPAPSANPNGKCGLEFNADGSQCQSCWNAKGVMISSSCAPLPGRASK
jgi:hypothetical protein